MWVKRALHDHLSGRDTARRGIACACQLPQALLSLQERVRVLRIEIVPGIAGAIHHNMCGHFKRGFGYRANRTARSQ